MNMNVHVLDLPPSYDPPPNYEEAISMFPDNTYDIIGYEQQHEVSSTTWARQPFVQEFDSFENNKVLC